MYNVGLHYSISLYESHDYECICTIIQLRVFSNGPLPRVLVYSVMPFESALILLDSFMYDGSKVRC